MVCRSTKWWERLAAVNHLIPDIVRFQFTHFQTPFAVSSGQYPPRQAKKWRDDEIPSRLEDQWCDLIEELFALQHDQGADGRYKSALVKLSDDARGLYRDYVNTTGAEQFGLTADLSASWSKLEETAVRQALVIHCIRQASGEPVDPWLCDADSMESGITLASWFKDETQRIYHLLTESQGDRDLRQAAEWIRQHGGTVRARDLVSGRRDIIDVKQADDLLQRLVNAVAGRRWSSVCSMQFDSPEIVSRTLLHRWANGGCADNAG